MRYIVGTVLASMALVSCTSTMGTPSLATTAVPEANRALLRAAAAGDVRGVRNALANGASVETADARGATALALAAYGHHVAAARVLVAAGADVDRKDDTVQSPYLIATSEVGDDPRLLDLFLRNGARVNDKDSYNGTGLIRAADRGFPRIVSRLIAAGVELDHVNRLGWTALHEAIVLGDGTKRYVEVVRRLAAAGADVHLPTQRDRRRPLEIARSNGYAKIAAILERAAARQTPNSRLLATAARGSAVAAREALRDGADLETRDERRRTPLLLAALNDRVAVAKLLVARGASADAQDDQRDSAFLVTGVTGSVPMLDALLPAKPNTRITNRFGGVAVIPASERGHVAYVRAVLAKTDIDVNHVNDLGWTALLEAVILGDGGRRHQQVVQALLAGGADKRIADRDGVTALEHARERGYKEIVRLLTR